ncbi:MAG TPA: Na+-dependent transporter [Candidatus Angelobacter sp.]|nr:Na+-dependent transporter [Candidatus Angelobacter sp.]
MVYLRIVLIALQASIFTLVFSLGLQATTRDVSYLWKRPSLLFRSLLSMNVVMPIFAVAMVAAFHLHPAVAAALVLLSVSPVPPFLPRQQLKLGGSSYVFGLLATEALLAIVLVPLTVNVVGRVFSLNLNMNVGAVAKVVLMTVLAPLALGILVRAIMPVWAERMSGPLARIAMAVVLVAALPLLFVTWRPMISLIGSGAVIAIIAFSVVGVVVGYWLGGPEPSERTTLSLATASRHPGLAMAIASANFSQQKRLIGAAIVLYVLVRTIALVPYNLWTKRRLAQTGPQQEQDQDRPAA